MATQIHKARKHHIKCRQRPRGPHLVCRSNRGPLTFVADICLEGQWRQEIKRWIATSVQEVAQIQQSHKPFQWTQVFVLMRSTRGALGGLLLEELNEVYLSGRFGSNIYRLTNGMAFMSDSHQASGDEDDSSTFMLIYSKQQSSRPAALNVLFIDCKSWSSSSLQTYPVSPCQVACPEFIKITFEAAKTLSLTTSSRIRTLGIEVDHGR